jgi:hypothetical protein
MILLIENKENEPRHRRDGQKSEGTIGWGFRPRPIVGTVHKVNLYTTFSFGHVHKAGVRIAFSLLPPAHHADADRKNISKKFYKMI